MSAALVASPGLAHAQALDLFYERTVMTAADQRCDLFAPDVSSALAASAAQARGAALRGGASLDAVRSVEARARSKAAQVACSSSDIATAASRVRNAFSGYAKLTRLSYPGDLAGWDADRNITREARWRLVQETRFGRDRLAFGLAGRDAPGVLMALGMFDDGARPYAARLLLRDARYSSGPYLYRTSGGATARLPLDKRTPPRSAMVAFTAEARSTAGRDLLPKDVKAGWAFRFPATASRELAALDPREAVVVEFLFAGDVTRRAYVEVGDFAAGSAFLKIAAR